MRLFRFSPLSRSAIQYARRTIMAAALCMMGVQISQAQAPLDAFHWIDFRDAKDAPTVTWVTQTLTAEKWTAIREIGVQWDAAIVFRSAVSTIAASHWTPISRIAVHFSAVSVWVTHVTVGASLASRKSIQ